MKPISHDGANWSGCRTTPMAADDEAGDADDQPPLLQALDPGVSMP